MSRTIRITPAGRLVCEAAGDTNEGSPPLEPQVAAELDHAFGRSSADGLLQLASHTIGIPLPPSLVFWREFAQRLFHDLCQLGERADQKGQELRVPANDALETMLAAAPPMQGLEYLSRAMLAQLWDELRNAAFEHARQHPEGIRGYLREASPIWHLLGRVTFHLAENKRDEQRPFAFLATFSQGLGKNSKVQHLPLGEALKQYAGARNEVQLNALLEPVRRAAAESLLVRELLDSRALFRPQAWTIPQAHRFLLEVPRMEAAGVIVRVPDWWQSRRPPRPQVEVRLGQRPAATLATDLLLDFSIQISLDGESLSDEEQRQILEAEQQLVWLRGKWVEVDSQRLQQALAHWQELESVTGDGISFIQGMRLLAGVSFGDETTDENAADWSRVTAGEWLRDTLATLRDPSRAGELVPGAELRATLRPYQIDGVRWLWFMHRLGLGACLADDMGLGKTIQVIDLLLQLKRSAAATPQRRGSTLARSDSERPTASLLIVPASLLGNWKQEIERFAPSLRMYIAHRSECDAEQLDQLEKNPTGTLADCDVVVTTYGVARRSAWPTKCSWRMVVLDEAQAIKNALSAQTRAVKKLSALTRVALTGTPVENHLGDLWSIFDFACPGLLGTAAEFKSYVKQLSKRQEATAYTSLRRLVQPYILRRLKTDPHIVPDLPEKTELRTECGLSKKQAVLYGRAVEQLADKLENVDGIARRGLVLSVLMQLKQICNHPAQFLHQSDYRPNESGKFGRLAELCELIVERQEKLLVFSQFQSICDPLADYLRTVFGRPGLVLTGKTAVRQRSALVREFQDESGPPFLVLSVKAGGTGLNLTAASHVVHFDRWWNPAVENQATDRAFRIGQRRNVLVHKFVCRGTVEERIDAMIRDKQQLADQVLADGAETQLTEMPDDELLRFVSLDLKRAQAEE